MNNGASVKIPGTVRNRGEITESWANKVRDALITLRDRVPPKQKKQARVGGFTHFRIHAQKESGTWKGYVGNGWVSATKEGTGSAMEINQQLAVTHEGTSIKLDITAPPWESGIDALVAANKGTSLTGGSLYYVSLEVTYAFRHIGQDNETDSSDASTVILGTPTAVITSFDTSIQLAGKASTYGDDLTRHWMLGVVDVPSSGTDVKVGQVWGSAVELGGVYRGHNFNTGLAADSGGDLFNSGVRSLAAAGTLSVDVSTGDVTVTD